MLTFGLFSSVAEAHWPRDATTLSDLSPPVLISNQENVYRHAHKANLMKTILQLRFPLPGCVCGDQDQLATTTSKFNEVCTAWS